jgi:hypothetical protein
MSIAVVASHEVIAAIPTAYADTVLADNPWGYWRGNTGGSPTLIDSGSEGVGWTNLALARLGAAPLIADGGKSMSGQTTGGPIASRSGVPSGLGGAATDTVSVEFWVDVPAGNYSGEFFHIGSHADGFAIGIGATTEDNLGRQLIFLNPNVAWLPTGYTMLVGTTHIGITRSSGGVFKIYANGSQVYTATYTHNAGTGLFLGADPDLSRTISSAIRFDDLVIYGTELAAARVSAHYNSGAGSAAAIAVDSPRIWLHLDETTQPLLDSSVNGRSLAATGPVTITTGRVDKAYDFPATAAYLAVPAFLPQPTNVTYECWLRIAALPAATTAIMEVSGGGGSGITSGLVLDTLGRVMMAIYNLGSKDTGLSAALALNTWHHIVGSVGPAGGKLRINKATVGTSVATSAQSATSGQMLIRAGGPLGATGTGAMQIAEPAAWLSQLSDARTDAHYDAA